MSVEADLIMFRSYLKDEEERIARIENDDFLKQILINRCESYKRLIKELEDG